MEQQYENLEVLDNSTSLEVENVNNTIFVDDVTESLNVEDDDTIFVDSGIISANDILESMGKRLSK